MTVLPETLEDTRESRADVHASSHRPAPGARPVEAGPLPGSSAGRACSRPITSIELQQRWVEKDPVVAAATSGDQSAFSQLFARHRREILAHAYRILGSREDAEDLTQETFLRSWNSRRSFRGHSSFRAWLYRIATNACLTALARQQGVRHHFSQSEGVDSDRLLEAKATPDASPDALAVSNETVAFALLVAIQHMPPRQRSVLILRDVLGWSAKDAADLLESSVASVNSALQRARATLRKHLHQPRLEWARASDPGDVEHALPGHVPLRT